jgi:hypothetical protein
VKGVGWVVLEVGVRRVDGSGGGAEGVVCVEGVSTGRTVDWFSLLRRMRRMCRAGG